MTDTNETLGKIASEATAAMTASVAEGVAAKTTAAMSDVYSVALQALSDIKIQIANLEHALELKRTQSMQEVSSFVAAAGQALDFASAIGRVLNNLENTAMGQPVRPIQ